VPPLSYCPSCGQPTRGIYLVPMSFEEIDEARRIAAETVSNSKSTGGRGKKRKNATIARLNPEVMAGGEHDGGSSASTNPTAESSDARTGRWTEAEIAYCDKLVDKFETGQLPLQNGVKLNEFLANMLKSKQSRLTKKMKNAKLSAKTFKRTSGCIVDPSEARLFSDTEEAFFRSVECGMERAEIRFHIQKEWREMFSSFCVQVGQVLDADTWLSSVEELDRRMSQAKDAARMARRKLMMGHALSQDRLNPDEGVFIEQSDFGNFDAADGIGLDDLMQFFPMNGHPGHDGTSAKKKSSRVQKPPFLAKVITYLQRHSVPFEHVDAWVPSFVSAQDPGAGPQSNCRLCFAGSATTDSQISESGRGSVPLSTDEHFDWFAFGEYSQKFSFAIGCGLPGRVYQSGIPCWEQNVEHAPHQHFERCGGAAQWGIKTVVAIPVPSPSVGRVVVLFYSRHVRLKDPEMVGRMANELSKVRPLCHCRSFLLTRAIADLILILLCLINQLVPSPKWKLVVDIGNPNLARSEPNEASAQPDSLSVVASDNRVGEVLQIIRNHTPTDSSSPLAGFLPGFTSLELMLTKSSHPPREAQSLLTLLASYSSYASSGRSEADIALLLARDFMMLSQQAAGQPPNRMQSNSGTSAQQPGGLMNPLAAPPNNSMAGAQGFSR
jgi:hypothetical protein